MRALDVFISHASDDQAVARELRAELESLGYSCWMAPDDVTGSTSWAGQILSAIEDSRAMIVLISTKANESEHVSREVALALGRSRAVLPIRIEPVAPGGSLEYLLSLVQRIDAFPPPISNHRAAIGGRLERILRAAAPTVADPVSGAQVAGGALVAGSRVGAFTIEGILGEGGMATVYRASQAEPRRAVALKVIRADRAADSTYRSRFLAEKDTLARLEHPSIVPIYAAGEADGVLYIAMRLVDGPDLRTRLKDAGRLTIAETASLLRPVADAVDYAHEMGVIHRDLKPSNIIIDRGGRPYLTDFGLGKQIGVSQGLSTPGVAFGTLEYMAPEQFGGPTDAALAPRIDIYSLGGVIFQCLTGVQPFAADAPVKVMHAHTEGPRPSVTALRPELPDAVDAVVKRALAIDPAERQPSARALIDELEAVTRVTDGQTVPVVIGASPTPLARLTAWVRSNTAAAAIAGALAVVVAVTLGAAALMPKAPSASPTASLPTASPALNRGPIGGTIALESDLGDDLTTDVEVSLDIRIAPTDSDGICALAASNDTERPLSSSAAWVAYDGTTRSYAHTLDEGTAGPRSVHVWFRDCAGNESDIATTGTTVFDNPPVLRDQPLYFNHDYCTGDHTFDLLATEPYAATDPDGIDTLRIVRAWTGGVDYPGTSDLTSSITADGKELDVKITGNGTGDVTITDYFTIEDDYGIQVSSYFTADLAGC